eukprot:Plantae.Rhodophyta-Purpureofilum_apyrenoidigerum.ctg15303.p1 GENE.Plantae.Rhodophyta-Purpureofilum_apyrenoidigerum.ctg15303~~Plantae.Rhodophyta-Purpureofilum_apyrenoidigerum.ctg15303.p1  ORF type:complete len:338 (-),score=29.31 Plantae.Rhodophyta-Purpureofilum_apyrenoidigerum.ctg15303:1036-2049(-)
MHTKFAALVWLVTAVSGYASSNVAPLFDSGAEVLPLPPGLVPLESMDGYRLLIDAVGLHTTFFPLAMNLATQMNQSFCAVATAVTLLNALDRRNSPVDPVYTPYRYFTQMDVFSSECAENVVREKWSKYVPNAPYIHYGMNLRQLQELLSCYVHAERVYISDVSIEDFRQTVERALQNERFVAVNVNRFVLGEVGGGHMSPVAAYNVRNDSMLFMDVARYKYPSAWIPVPLLYASMETIDITSDRTRGFVVASARESRESTHSAKMHTHVKLFMEHLLLSAGGITPVSKHTQLLLIDKRHTRRLPLLLGGIVCACTMLGFVFTIGIKTRRRRKYVAL